MGWQGASVIECRSERMPRMCSRGIQSRVSPSGLLASKPAGLVHPSERAQYQAEQC